MISTVFMDVDNTLLDFNACALCSMKDAFAHYDLPFFEEVVFPTFLRINDRLWGRIEEGTLTKAEHYQIRWKTILKELKIDFDGLKLEKKFVEGLHEYAVPVEGALQMMKDLHAMYRICITSNAPYEQQMHRMEKAGLLPYVDAVYISEKIGHQKPSLAFFEHCLHDQKVKKEHVVVVGDSLQADMFGGLQAGLKTIWYNPGQKPEKDIHPDAQVRMLKDVLPIVRSM